MSKYSHKEAANKLRAAGASPIDTYSNANTRWRSKCLKCKREIFPTLANILNGHAACVYCSGKKVHPDDAKELMIKNNLIPKTPYPGSTKKWKCVHSPCGKTVYPTYSSIVSGRKGCTDCGRLATAKKIKLDSKIPSQDMKNAGFKPLVEYPGRNKP
jgi:DNA-directed RNA polymerase subunit RPC12/RpoP